MNRNVYWLTPAAILGSAVAGYATTYLSVEQAQELIFPGSKFVEADVTLNEQQRKAIERASGVQVRQLEQKVWSVVEGGWFIVEEVVGKHEFITYAVGLNADGSVI
jgi:hypothetical protein